MVLAREQATWSSSPWRQCPTAKCRLSRRNVSQPFPGYGPHVRGVISARSVGDVRRKHGPRQRRHLCGAGLARHQMAATPTSNCRPAQTSPYSVTARHAPGSAARAAAAARGDGGRPRSADQRAHRADAAPGRSGLDHRAAGSGDQAARRRGRAIAALAVQWCARIRCWPKRTFLCPSVN